VARLEATGRERWAHVSDGVSTLAGEAPQAVVGPGGVVALTATNLGYRLQRLDADAGKPLWERPPLLRQHGVDARGWSLDEGAVYYVAANVCYSRSLRDGKLLWEQALAGPEGEWRTERLGGVLLVHPQGAPDARFQFRWLCVTVQWRLSVPTEGWPALCLDPATGQVVQRLNFAAEPPRSWLEWARRPGFAMVPSLGVDRAGRGGPGPAVQRSGSGLLAGGAGEVWAFAGATK
jgi:hypothetical protein